MNKWLLSFIVLFVITVVGCSSNELTGSKPPTAMIRIGEEVFPTKLGSYCWTVRNKSTCVDTAGPVELLENDDPILVNPGEEIIFEMDYAPRPDVANVIQVNGSNETEVVVEDNRFTVPEEKGVYYYSYGVWWMDKKEPNVSNGDAFYSFFVEVQ